MTTLAENVIYELWITFTERLFQRIVDVTELSAEQADALRQVVLRPNDFHIQIVDS
jgi:hypothetical protein